MHILKLFAFALLSSLAVAQAPTPAYDPKPQVEWFVPRDDQATVMLRANPGLSSLVKDSDLLKKLRQHVPQVVVDGTIYHVVEGDILRDEQELGIYAVQQEALGAAIRQISDPSARTANAELANLLVASGPELTALQSNGKPARWAPEAILSYRVQKDSFPDLGKYSSVVANIHQAASEWEAICGVTFAHKNDLDEKQGSSKYGTLFVVRFLAADAVVGNASKLVAESFFPLDGPAKRFLLVMPSYFATSYDGVGVLRHELGHILGFRHEHIRMQAPAPCKGEALLYAGVYPPSDLTPYDPKSVMHYFCGGEGSLLLAFSQVDREGAVKLYGPSKGSYLAVGTDIAK